MRTILLLAPLVVAATDAPPIDGRRLSAVTTCYAITLKGAPVGATFQSVRPVMRGGRPAWDIVVHQRAAAMGFDLRDHVVVDRRTLMPMTLDSRRGTNRSARGWHRITVDYGADRIRGTRESAAGTTAIDVPREGPVWEGNLWGLTFAALPLREGARYAIPFWQYDKGFGRFSVAVVGSRRVGTVDAWIVDAGDDPARPARYLIAKRSRAELGYDAGPSAQREGGDCTGLD